MKRFRFALESVRTLREQKEREAQQRYAERVRACQAAATRLQVLELERESCWRLVREQVLARTTAQALAHSGAYAGAIEERRQQAQADLRAAQQRLEEAQAVLNRASRDHDGMKRHRDKLLRAHRRAEERGEQKFLDELGGRAAALAPLLARATLHP
jgi:flagellar export protein FliJ